MSQELINAVHNNDFQQVSFLLNRGVDINSMGELLMERFYYQVSPLHRAALDKNIPMMEFLLNHGANIEAIGNEKAHGVARTPLGMLVAEYAYDGNDSVSFLLQHGASIDVIGEDHGNATVAQSVKPEFKNLKCTLFCEAIIRADRGLAFGMLEKNASFSLEDFLKQLGDREIKHTTLIKAEQLLDELKEAKKIIPQVADAIKLILQCALSETIDSAEYPQSLKFLLNNNSIEQINGENSLQVLTALFHYARNQIPGKVIDDLHNVEYRDDILIENSESENTPSLLQQFYDFLDPKNAQQALQELHLRGNELVEVICMAAVHKGFTPLQRSACLRLLERFEHPTEYEKMNFKLDKILFDQSTIKQNLEFNLNELKKDNEGLKLQLAASDEKNASTGKQIDELMQQNRAMLNLMEIMNKKISHLENNESNSIENSVTSNPFWRRTRSR